MSIKTSESSNVGKASTLAFSVYNNEPLEQHFLKL